MLLKFQEKPFCEIIHYCRLRGKSSRANHETSQILPSPLTFSTGVCFSWKHLCCAEKWQSDAGGREISQKRGSQQVSHTTSGTHKDENRTERCKQVKEKGSRHRVNQRKWRPSRRKRSDEQKLVQQSDLEKENQNPMQYCLTHLSMPSVLDVYYCFFLHVPYFPEHYVFCIIALLSSNMNR